MNAGELCTREVESVNATDNVMEAARRMIMHHVGSVVVVRGPGLSPRPVGMLTDRDLLKALLASADGPVGRRLVADLMTTPPVTVNEQASVDEALSPMRRAGVRRLPVVSLDGRLVGILAYDDLVEWYAESLGMLSALSRSQPKRERERG